jgi:glycerophosphoryl diester phosphodiesterase
MFQIAHRGNSQEFGDNNLTSFNSALDNHFDMIELDVQLCKTGEIVIYHDIDINNTPIYVKDCTLDYLKNIGIITLNEFLDTISIDDIRFFFDVKGHEDVIYPLIEIIKSRFNEKQIERIYISGFNRKFERILVDSKLPINIGFTTENTFETETLVYLCKNCNFACLHWNALDKDSITELHNTGTSVFSYTCKNRSIQEHMMTFDLDGIVTNYPLDLEF